MLEAMNTEDLSRLYDLWAPRGDSAENLRTRLTAAGTFDLETFRGTMADYISDTVANADQEVIRQHGNNAVKALLRIQDFTGPAKRYMRGMTIDDSILKHKQKLPKEISELYGQINDIPSLIASTLTRQGELSSRTDLLNRIRDGFNANGTPMVVSKSESGLPEYAAYTVELSADSFGPLKGMMTTPETAQALTDYSEAFLTLADTLDIVGYKPSLASAFLADKAGKAIQWQAGMQKRMSILTRPDYLLMNLAGSVVSPVMVGGVDPGHLLTGMKVALESIAHTLDPKGSWHDANISTEMRLALEMGLLDNPVTQEIRNLPRKQLQALIKNMNEAGTVEQAQHLLRDAMATGGRAWQAWVEAYSMSDAWVKLPITLQRMDYLNAFYEANGDSKTNEEVLREAADFTKNSTLTMTRVPGIAKAAERAGITRFGPYIASVFRVLAYQPLLISQDVNRAIAAKTPEARRIAAIHAARHMAGLSSVTFLTMAGLKMLADSLLEDDDREQLERDRHFMYENDKYADLIYLGTNGKGERQYFNLSRLDQFGPAFDILRALRGAGSTEEKMRVVKDSALDTFIWSASLGAIAKAGLDIITPPGVSLSDKSTRIERVMPEAAQAFKDFTASLPGLDYSDGNTLLELADKFLPAGPANIIDPANKGVEDPATQGAAIFSAMVMPLGHKLVTVAPEAAINRAAMDYSSFKKEANKMIKDTLNVRGPEAALDVFVDKARDERAKVIELGTTFQALVDSGVSSREAMRMLKEAGLDATTIKNIRAGTYNMEAEDWIRRRSSLLSKELLREPPKQWWSTDADKEARADEWRNQVKEVKKRIAVMGYDKENN